MPNRSYCLLKKTSCIVSLSLACQSFSATRTSTEQHQARQMTEASSLEKGMLPEVLSLSQGPLAIVPIH